MPILALSPPVAADKLSGAWRGADSDRDARSPGAREPANDFSFGDLLDIFNPLQHLPIIGTIYREITGDRIGMPARIMGGTLFGGLPGLIASMVDTVVEGVTGKDMGRNVMALLRPGEPAGGDGGGAAIFMVSRAERGGGALVARASNIDDRSGNDGDEIAAFLDRSRARAEAESQLVAGAGFDPGLDEAADATPPAAIVTARATRDGAAPEFGPVAAPAPRTGPGVQPLADTRDNFQATPPVPLRSSVPLGGVRGAFTGLPAPELLAANPSLIAAAARSAANLNEGGSAAARSAANSNEGGSAAARSAANLNEGGSAAARGAAPAAGGSTAAWARLMEAANGEGLGEGGGLATATIAKAMARYAAPNMTGLPGRR